jgi:hypothetical protein
MAFVRIVPAAQPLERRWTGGLFTNADENAYELAVSPGGGIYAAGFERSLTLPDPFTYHAFISKFDQDGSVVWTDHIATSEDDHGYSVSAAPDGGAYLVGSTDGALTANDLPRTDAFIRRYDANGGIVWTRQFGTSGSDVGIASVSDAFGNLYIAGTTDGQLGNTYVGSYDIFVTKFNPSGQQLWSTQFGSLNGDEVSDIQLDSGGNLLVAGTVGGPVDGLSGNGSLDNALAGKLSSDGAVQWLRPHGTRSFNFGGGIAEDGQGGAFLVGTKGFSFSSYDMFIVHFDENGNELWEKPHAAAGIDRANRAQPDGHGGVILTGSEFIQFSNPNDGIRNGLILRFDQSGEMVWQERVFGLFDLNAIEIAGPELYVAGYYEVDPPGGTPENQHAVVLAFRLIPEPTSTALLFLGLGIVLTRPGGCRQTDRARRSCRPFEF